MGADLVVPSPAAGGPDAMPWWSAWVLGGLAAATLALVGVVLFGEVADWIRGTR